MSGPCSSYAIAGDESSGPCTHPAGYQDSGSADWCACHYGEPYDRTECSSKAPADVPQLATTRDAFIASLGSALGWHWEEAPGVPSAEDVLTGIHDALREEGLLVSADQVRAETLKEALRILQGEFEPLVNREPNWHNVASELTTAMHAYHDRAQS